MEFWDIESIHLQKKHFWVHTISEQHQAETFPSFLLREIMEFKNVKLQFGWELNLLTWKPWCSAQGSASPLTPRQPCPLPVGPSLTFQFCLLFSKSFESCPLRETLLGEFLALTIKSPPNRILGFSSSFGCCLFLFSYKHSLHYYLLFL